MLRRSPLKGGAAAGALGLAVDSQRARRHYGRSQKRRILVIGMEAAYVPYKFVEYGKIIGYDPDAIAIMGLEEQLIDTA